MEFMKSMVSMESVASLDFMGLKLACAGIVLKSSFDLCEDHTHNQNRSILMFIYLPMWFLGVNRDEKRNGTGDFCGAQA